MLLTTATSFLTGYSLRRQPSCLRMCHPLLVLCHVSLGLPPINGIHTPYLTQNQRLPPLPFVFLRHLWPNPTLHLSLEIPIQHGGMSIFPSAPFRPLHPILSTLVEGVSNGRFGQLHVKHGLIVYPKPLIPLLLLWTPFPTPSSELSI